MNNKRILYGDILKILASIAVVVIHVSAMQWYEVDINSNKWMAMNIYDSLCRWAVPIFVMVTGMLLLSPKKKISIKDIFCKYILKICILLMVWEFIYAIVNQVKVQNEVTILSIINNMLEGQYHLYYLYMLIGMYVITPIIKEIINNNNENIIKYFLLLWMATQILLNTISNIFEITETYLVLQVLFNKMQISLVMGYVGYYILGYYLSTKECSKRNRIVLYSLGVISYVMTILLTKHFNKNESFYGYFSVMTFIEAVAIFVLVKQICSKININEKVSNVITKITKLTLGVYIVHPIFITIFERINIMPSNWNTYISLPVISVVVYSLSLFVTYIFFKILDIIKVIKKRGN